jgi:putative transcription antitermination factor YqgF
LRARVTTGHQLVADSIDVKVGEPVVSGQTVSFTATATGQEIAVLDPEALRTMILGKPLEAARQLLAPCGAVEVTAWPDWSDRSHDRRPGRSQDRAGHPGRDGSAVGVALVTRLLGIDLGERRIGLAIAEGDGAPARAHSTVRRTATVDRDAAALGIVVASDRIDELVVGLPFDMSGSEAPQAIATRAWAAAIGQRLGIPVTLRDERLRATWPRAAWGR